MRSVKNKCRVLIFSLLLLAAGSNFASPGENLHWVKRVVDGDTLLLKSKERVRLIGVDTPEVHESAKLHRDSLRTRRDEGTIQILGEMSAGITRRLVQGRLVRLEYGRERRDSHDRLLAYVYFKMREDRFAQVMGHPFLEKRAPVEKEYMLNRVLIQYGFAYAYTRYPFPYAEEFRRLEKAARERSLGLWRSSQKI